MVTYPKWLPSYGAYKNLWEKMEKNYQKGITWKLYMGEQSLLRMTHCLYLIHNSIKFHEAIPNGYQVGCTRMKITQNKQKKYQRAITLKRKNGKQQ